MQLLFVYRYETLLTQLKQTIILSFMCELTNGFFRKPPATAFLWLPDAHLHELFGLIYLIIYLYFSDCTLLCFSFFFNDVNNSVFFVVVAIRLDGDDWSPDSVILGCLFLRVPAPLDQRSRFLRSRCGTFLAGHLPTSKARLLLFLSSFSILILSSLLKYCKSFDKLSIRKSSFFFCLFSVAVLGTNFLLFFSFYYVQQFLTSPYKYNTN